MVRKIGYSWMHAKCGFWQVVKKYGADALRLYLINSPVVRGENLRFREEGVRDVVKDVFLPWYNAYRFFIQNLNLYEHVSSWNIRIGKRESRVFTERGTTVVW